MPQKVDAVEFEFDMQPVTAAEALNDAIWKHGPNGFYEKRKLKFDTDLVDQSYKQAHDFLLGSGLVEEACRQVKIVAQFRDL
jgi:hypothetical protein